MLRERTKWRTHKVLNTDAVRRGGVISSSDEASVMEVEQRDHIVQLL